MLFTDPAIPYLTWMKNSLIIAGATAVLSVSIGSASAFALVVCISEGEK
jgi:ABC-type maltose transport system permease subunit